MLFTLTICFAARANAEESARGFALERFSRAPAGAAWLSVDSLDMPAGLAASMAFTTSYAHRPLRVPSAIGPRLSAVSHQALANFGFAASYERLRVYLEFDMPLVVNGESGSVAGYAFENPAVDLGTHPDTLGDARLGLSLRALGEPTGPLRLGVSAELFVPNGNREEYVTDGSYRGIGRLHFAGDSGRFSYAAQTGVHLRSLDERLIPASPRGNELVFAAAAGVRLIASRDTRFLIGPELWGASSLRHLGTDANTALEWLFAGRLETFTAERTLLGVSLGAGTGLNPEFGAPKWRALLSVQVSGRAR